jgi:hypothetical protein
MKIRCLEPNREVVNSTTTKTYPADWVGDVSAALGAAWVKAGTAVALQSHDASALTPTETAVLKAVAQQALAQVGQETVDPNTGEVNPPQSVAEILAGLTSKELKDFAKTKGVKVTARKREAIEADLVELIEAEQAAASA